MFSYVIFFSTSSLFAKTSNKQYPMLYKPVFQHQVLFQYAILEIVSHARLHE